LQQWRSLIYGRRQEEGAKVNLGYPPEEVIVPAISCAASVAGLAMIGMWASACSAWWPSRFTTFRTAVDERPSHCLKIVSVVSQKFDFHLTTL